MEGVWGMAEYFDQVKYTKFSGDKQGEGMMRRGGDGEMRRGGDGKMGRK
jgi:hypothetical protein